jgi:DNA-binding transcriptional ArsR family regulator
MEKDKIIELTIKLYKITLLFPKKEPLRYKIREIADEILANFTVWEVFHRSDYNDFEVVEKDKKDLVFNIKKDIEIIISYLEISKWQNWVSYFDILSIEQEYDKIRSVVEKTDIKEKIPETKSLIDVSKDLAAEQKIEQSSLLNDLDNRKQKIIEILKQKGKVQVGEISEILSQVSKRTIRRDFVQLLEQGLIERIGQRNDTFYKLKIRTNVGQI